MTAARAKVLRARLAEAHAKHQPVTQRFLLAEGFTAAEIRSAHREGVVSLQNNPNDPSNPLVLSTVIEPTAYHRAAQSAAVPRPKPETDGSLQYWRRQNGRLYPFAVRVQHDGRTCIVRTTEGERPAVANDRCWLHPLGHGGLVLYPAEANSHALQDAWDANEGADEGVYSSPPPWRHPTTDYPLRDRKP